MLQSSRYDHHHEREKVTIGKVTVNNSIGDRDQISIDGHSINVQIKENDPLRMVQK